METALTPLLDQLLTLPALYDPKLSPDGRWVAFTWYRVHENADVFVVPTDGSARPLALTHTPEYTEIVRWSPDSRSVVVREDHDGDERARLFRVALDAPEVMIPLTEDHPSYFIQGGSLHPDGRRLFYGMNYDVEACKELETTWIYCHDLETGERTPIGMPVRAFKATPYLNIHGTHILYTRRDYHPSGTQIHLIDLTSGEDREILNFGEKVKVWAQWLADGEQITFLSEATEKGRDQDHISLGVYRLADGAIRWLIDDPNRALESIHVSPDGPILVDEIQGARHKVSSLDPTTGSETPFPQIPGNLVPFGRAANGQWVAEYSSSTWPMEIVTFEGAPQTLEDLTSLTQVWERTSLPREALTQAQDFRWQSPDGLEIQGWLYRTAPNQGKAIVYVHGGPTWHNEDQINTQIQYYVSQGFTVLDVNYRGSTGFGKLYRLAINEDGWGGREQEDIAAGARALIEAGLAQPGKVGITGLSYGGYSSWFAITHQPADVIGAAVPVCGMTDLVVDYETTRPDLRPYSEEMMGGTPEQVPDRYYERSPINFVKDIRGKLLIVQGGVDPNVTPQHVTNAVVRLNEHKIPHEVLVFEDEGHGIYKPANQRRLYATIVEFFNQAFA